VVVALLVLPAVAGAQNLRNSAFTIRYSDEGITSLRRTNDVADTEYIANGGSLGRVVARYRTSLEGDWHEIAHPKLAGEAAGNRIEYRIGDPQDLSVSESFQLEGGQFAWSIKLANQTNAPLEVGDLAVPTEMAEGTPGRRGDIYTQKLLRHGLIAGSGSWMYWSRSNGVGPYLLMTPIGATKLEYFDNSVTITPNNAGRGGRGGRGVFTPYIHAIANNAADIQKAREAGREQPWRLPLTSLHLAPQGSKGSEVTYQFRFEWVPDLQGVRDALYADNLFDTVIVPGMTVPINLAAFVALRTRNHIDAVEPEFPAKTSIQYVGERGKDTHVYKVQFNKLGENMLKIRYGGQQWTSLEFFITEPLETVVQKRSKFLVEKMQHMDSTEPWYGAYGDWDELKQVLRNPQDRDGMRPWLTDSSDDAGNARPALVAGVNAFFPTAEGVASVERYVRYYLFNDYKDGKGGMQMTEKEAYPFGIYGTFDNWWQHRAAPDAPPDTYEPGNANRQRDWTVLHRDHLWRIYDYPHIINMYHRLYQIGKFYPGMLHWRTSAQYLELAYRTAVAYWTVPLATRNWSANSVGTMNEACIEDLIDSLEEEGKQQWANELRSLWETKVAHFVLNTPNLYGSEFAFDSTGFESTQAFARYAVRNAGKSHVDPPNFAVGPGRGEIPKFSEVTPEAARKFQDFQMQLNVNDRGWIETAYYLLGSDYRGSTSYLQSYMSHLGGWAVLDHGLNFAANPTDYIRLGYASALSAWCLVNSGTAESGYGYWYPAKANDGATGGGFVPEAWGRGWIGKTMPRGAWHYSAEEDVGYVGSLRTLATVVVNDPVFGDYAYGGILTRARGSVRVIARDGLRMRLHVIRNQQRLHLLFDNDGFAAEQPITISDDLSTLAFRIENRAKRPHDTHMRISGMPSGTYAISVNGSPVGTFPGSDREQIMRVPLPAGEDAAVTIRRH